MPIQDFEIHLMNDLQKWKAELKATNRGVSNIYDVVADRGEIGEVDSTELYKVLCEVSPQILTRILELASKCLEASGRDYEKYYSIVERTAPNQTFLEIARFYLSDETLQAYQSYHLFLKLVMSVGRRVQLFHNAQAMYVALRTLRQTFSNLENITALALLQHTNVENTLLGYDELIFAEDNKDINDYFNRLKKVVEFWDGNYSSIATHIFALRILFERI